MAQNATSASALPSIRSKIVMLVLACALPTVLGFAALGYDAYARQREQLSHDATRMAQALMNAVERDLSACETAAQALAVSPSLDTGDLAAFRGQASTLLADDFPAFAFVLSDASGVPLLNTRYAPGDALPPNGNLADLREAIASGHPNTSDLYPGDAQQPRMVSVNVPVLQAGIVHYVLSAQLRPERLNRLLTDQYIPTDWNGQIFDRKAVFVARSRSAHQVIGQLANPALRAAMAGGETGIVHLISREGVPVVVAYTRSAERGWYVSVGAPRASAGGALGDSVATMLASVAALLTIGFLTAWIIGGRIGRSVRALSAPAVALGRGEPLAIAPMTIREPAEVAAALVQMDGEMQRYRNELEQLVAQRTDQLQRSNALLATVYATAPVGLSLLDCDLRVVMVNDYLAALNGLPVEAHLGRTLPDILGPIGIEYERAYRHVRDTGEALPSVESSSVTLASPDQERHWIVSYHPVYGADHQMMGISAVVIDISERKQLSQRLHDINEQFHVLYEMSGDAHMLLAQGAGFIGGNRAAAKVFGCDSVEQFLTLSPAITSPPFQPDGQRSDVKADQMIRQALDTGSHHFEWLHQRVTGELFHADVLLTSLNIGRRGILQATVRDISERIAADLALRATGEQLRQRERFIRTVTDNVPGMVGYWDGQLRCQFANRLYLTSFGLTEQQLLGQPIHAVISTADLQEITPHLREVMAGRAAHFAREHEGDGERRYTWSDFIPDFDEQGDVRGFYVLVSDISDLKRTELHLQSLNEQLVQALDQAEMASSAKTEFLANMSHEIRTPMNAIMGLARLLEEAPLARRERDYVAKMTLATRSLLGILNDVLDFSKIEAGQLGLEATRFTLEQVLRSVSVLLGPSAFEKGIELVFSVAPEVPLALVGDPMRLEQVLLNLVGNAIKFTEAGEVVLSVGLAARDGGADTALTFDVRDSGIGIDPSQHESMFEAFSQGDSSTSRKFGGTGLGLAICRRLVRLMGGTIEVESELGKGARFTFDSHFGAAVPAETLDMPRQSEQGRSYQLLVVDDNASVRAAIGAQCAAHGWQVVLAASGAQAQETMRCCQFDFLLIDSAMPDMDGISLLTHLRAEHPGAPPCAMMVAESARERLAELADDLHLSAMLAKPATPARLAAALRELVSGRQAPDSAPSTQPLAGRLQGVRVLLVEDNQINQEVANYILLHAGATVDIAANGFIAVTMLTDHPRSYDAVLMDIQMPVMNGYEATQRIRAMGLTDLPIVAMTANAMEDDRAHAIGVGMNGHVAKPIDVDSLISALNRVTAGGAARERRAPASTSDAIAAAPPDHAGPGEIDGIDLRPTLQRFGGSYANFVSVFKRFEHSQGATMPEVRTLVAAGCRNDGVAVLHRLRGVAANLGASNVATLALEAEHALREAGEAELMVRLATLESALARVFRAARELPEPQAAGVPASPLPSADGAPPDLNAGLANLLTLLQNNNMKALAAYGALRPLLDAQLSDAAAKTLADAVSTLAFASAATQIEAVMNQRGNA